MNYQNNDNSLFAEMSRDREARKKRKKQETPRGYYTPAESTNGETGSHSVSPAGNAQSAEYEWQNQAAPGKIEPKPQEKDFGWKEPEPAPQEMQSLDAEKLWLGGHDATFNEILELENVLALGGEEQEVDAFINAQQNIENRKQQLRREGYTNRQIEQELEKKRREANKAFTATVQKA